MTPLARVEAAILRLETLKTESTPGPWQVVVTGGDHYHVFTYGEMERVASIRTDDGDNEAVREPDATLICLLQSTIDPMLELLQGAARYMAATGDYAHDVVLVLADAILGDTK